MEEFNYLTTVHTFDDIFCFTMLSLMYPKLLFYCYSPLDFDLFIYKFNSEKQETIIIRTHIYENSVDVTNIYLIKN